MPAGLTESRFDEKYIEACFFAWYNAGAPRLKTRVGTTPVGKTQIVKVLPVTTDGRKPDIKTVRVWADKYGWDMRAQALDAEVSIKLEREAVEHRISVLRELAKTGETLMNKGLNYITTEDNPFKDNPSAAVRAIVAGSEMQFKYAAQADKLAVISQMSDKQIESEIQKYLGMSTEDENENTDQGSEEESEESPEIVDATSTDIPEDESEDDNSRTE